MSNVPDTLAALHARCFPDRPWSAPEIAALVNAPTTLAFVDATQRGFALLQSIPPEAEILTICVAPDMRRQGVAAALMQDVFGACKARGIDRVFLDVAADNSAAIALYARLGFDTIGRRKAYYKRKDGPRQDAVIMQRAVT